MTTKTKTRLRKKPSDPESQLKMVALYSKGVSVEDIADTMNLTPKWVKTSLEKFYVSFKETIETEALIEEQKIAMKTGPLTIPEKVTLFKSQTRIDKDINSKFLDKLSDPNSNLLTEEEMLFCRLLVYEGDEVKALQDSGLSEGLSRVKGTAQRPVKLRILLLKQKKNVMKFLHDLQIDYAKELNVSKEMVQTEIITQLQQLKAQNDPKHASVIAKLTEQLGRTVGAFTDKVTVEEVSFDDAMDRMMEMRQVGPQGGALAGEPNKAPVEPTTFVYDPEAIG